MQHSKGFTLIELMIVVAIIAILASLAIPAYRDYLIRTQVTEGATLISSAKIAVDEYYWNYGVSPADNGEAGISGSASIKGNYVSSITIGANGTITAAFGGSKANAALSGKFLQFAPNWTSPGSTIWHCNGAGTTIDPKYRPSICR